MLLKFVLIASYLALASADYPWSFQTKLTSTEAGNSFGSSHSTILGRGFVTLISGYGQNTSGIYVHTTDSGFAHRGYAVWTQQAKLVGRDSESGDQFGKWMANDNYTILASAPNWGISSNGLGANAGAVYVFNGTLRHWTQMQRLTAKDSTGNDNFGTLLKFQGNRLLIGAVGNADHVGAAYVYERLPGALGSMAWSRQGKLVPRDGLSGQYFAETIALDQGTVIVGARNDYEAGYHSGSAYVFSNFAGQWSQQQKLLADDLKVYQPKRDFIQLGYHLPVMFFGNDVALKDNVAAFGIRRQNLSDPFHLWKSVYLFNGYSTNRWSVQQKLYIANDTTGLTAEQIDRAQVQITYNNKLLASVSGPTVAATYIFESSGNSWSQHQRLMSPDTNNKQNFSSPSYYGGTFLFHGTNDLKFESTYRNDSCLLIYMSDHFGDGWGSAVLTVRAPDTTNDTFHPHCDQVDPFYVRYCPYQPEDEGVYIVKVFAPQQAQFFWEISWRVQVESTGEWYRGDFATKMKFNFNAKKMQFDYYDAENLIDMNAPCYRCTAIAFSSWAQMQVVTGNSFWPLAATGAPYYISNYYTNIVVATGKVCDGVGTYHCQEYMSDGIYVLRLGGGLFGKDTLFPKPDARWEGCGASGTHRDQMVFQISGGVCSSLQVFTYTGRCVQPPQIDFDGVSAPTAGGTVAPTVNIYGPPFVQYEMYGLEGRHQPVPAVGTGDQHESTDMLALLRQYQSGHTGLNNEASTAAAHAAVDQESRNTEQLDRDSLDKEVAPPTAAARDFSARDMERMVVLGLRFNSVTGAVERAPELLSNATVDNDNKPDTTDYRKLYKSRMYTPHARGAVDP